MDKAAPLRSTAADSKNAEEERMVVAVVVALVFAVVEQRIYPVVVLNIAVAQTPLPVAAVA